MSKSSPDLSRWASITSYISRHVDLDTSAREHGALVRRRGVRSAADLLQLALLYGPGGMSLRSTASFAVEGGIADVCDVSLLDRLRNSGDWLTCILNELLARKRDRPIASGGLRLTLSMARRYHRPVLRDRIGAFTLAMSLPLARSPT